MNNHKFDVSKLSLDEKIGQLLMFGFEGESIDDKTIEFIKKYKAGNVILFTRNIKSGEQLYNLNKQLQEQAIKHLDIPMFIGIDQEGGMVSRIQQGATFFPGAMTISANGSLEDCYNVGDKMGSELKSLGVNMNFAPVLDVNNNPKNPVIGVRSYSDDPKVVSQYGQAFIKGMQNHVIATGKHFPGHGDTHVDSHLALPKVEYDLDRLEKVEFVPFVDSIHNGLHAMMSSHIDFPHLTKDGLPTTLSEDVLTKLLRNKLGFKGLIVTDGMTMKSIESNYGTVEACLMAVKAGANIYCICHSRDYQIQAIKRFREAIINKEIDEALIDQRVQLILDYKKQYVSVNFDQTYEDVKDIVENDETKALSYSIVEGAASLVKGKKLSLSDRALFVGIMPKATTIADEALGHYDIFKGIEKEIPKLDIIKLPLSPSNLDILEVIEKAKAYDQLIVTTYNGNVFQEQIKMIDYLSELGKEMHVISMRNPYDLYYTKNITNYVCLYEYTPNSIKVLLKYLKGSLKLKGKVPVKYE
ncbi:MAG: beta-N-acetylhexosaminidase [Acholeplasmataceae bacterium]|nr:beta-N-acetylhexosaminidase [Acholeplasmataceae bacterium]